MIMHQRRFVFTINSNFFYINNPLNNYSIILNSTKAEATQKLKAFFLKYLMHYPQDWLRFWEA